MTTDLTERLDLPPGLRVAWHAYLAYFGEPPATVWQVPGTVSLLADGPLRLTVATPWTAIVAAGSRPGALIELIKMEYPDQRQSLTVPEAVAGAGPPWAGAGLRSARTGANLLIKSELPEGSGAGVRAATETAIRLCLIGMAGSGASLGEESVTAGHAMAGGRQLPFDLASAGLRLALIDTRVRGAVPPVPAESSPVSAADEMISWGDISVVGPLMTVAHRSLPCDEVQHIAVSAALRAGAAGARAITDGPGRPVCALVSVNRLADVRAALADAFAARQLRPPRLLTFTPAPGPQQVC
jgi:galactokinase